ncbi:MAG: alpha/beta fold hydrolase [Gemmatimonadaceae bacterium]|nr:alpha/beta fold hydrolase [Gemmatimonadaceae bacterium]
MTAGLRSITVHDVELGLEYPAVVCYPTPDTSAGTMLGPYVFEATRDAPIAAGIHPLAVVSHGGGGSHLLYRSIATHLAAHGWIVVCPEHPGDNRNDRSLVNTDLAAARRARHASLALDAVIAHEALGAHVDRARIAAIGHSMGGLTALTMVGGQPWSMARVPLDVQHDPRVRAAVLLAPATDWFMAPDALARVRTPLLVYVAEHDPVTPPTRVRAVLAHLPPDTPCDMREVAGGGHFAFLTPFPDALRRPDFPPSQDPPGFDRTALHTRLPAEILAWLETTVR